MVSPVVAASRTAASAAVATRAWSESISDGVNWPSVSTTLTSTVAGVGDFGQAPAMFAITRAPHPSMSTAVSRVPHLVTYSFGGGLLRVKRPMRNAVARWSLDLSSGGGIESVVVGVE